MSRVNKLGLKKPYGGIPKQHNQVGNKAPGPLRPELREFNEAPKKCSLKTSSREELYVMLMMSVLLLLLFIALTIDSYELQRKYREKKRVHHVEMKEVLYHIHKLKEHIMANLDEVKAAIADEKAQVLAGVDALKVKIQELQDLISAGTGVTSEDLDALITSVNDIFVPEVVVEDPPVEPPVEEPTV